MRARSRGRGSQGTLDGWTDEPRNGHGSVGTRPIALVMLLAATGCGSGTLGSPDADDAQPDAEDTQADTIDVPPGHVLFSLSFRKAPPDPGGSPALQTAYLQQADVEWLDSTGTWQTTTRRDWLFLVDPVRNGLTAKPDLCPCEQCGVCVPPSEADGTKVILTQVVAVRDGEEASYEWDGRIWIRGACPDASECVSIEQATPGRYAVEFNWGLNCGEDPPYRFCSRVVPPFGSSGPIYFDYPGTSVVRHTIDCSAETNYAVPGEPCI
jgi:hypothetical protein